jgi:hypothetical protein
MGILKILYKDTKQDIREIINSAQSVIDDFYYAYIRKDEYSKNDMKFHLLRIWYNLGYPFRNIARGIKNIWKWRVIIWEDRDFDYSYMYAILQNKLKNMEKFFYSDEVHIMDAEKYADQIKECREIVDALINDTYFDEELKEYHEKYPEVDNFFTFTPSDSEKERVEQGLPVRWYEMKDRHKDDEKIEMFREGCDRAEKRRAEAIKKLYNNLAEYGEGWWD